MAGSLGVSSLVCLLNNGGNGNSETSQSLLGPFWRLNSPRVANGGTIVRSDTPGDPLFVTGRVVDTAGKPVAGAEVDIWHASPFGLYENQDPEQADMNLRGKFTTDDDGRFWFSTVKMTGYPIPTDGVVGRLLQAQNRHPYRPAHLHALIVKEGFKVLISQVYDPEGPAHRHRPAVRRHESASRRLRPPRGAAIHPTLRSARPGIPSTIPTSWSRAKRSSPRPRSSDAGLASRKGRTRRSSAQCVKEIRHR